MIGAALILLFASLLCPFLQLNLQVVVQRATLFFGSFFQFLVHPFRDFSDSYIRHIAMINAKCRHCQNKVLTVPIQSVYSVVRLNTRGADMRINLDYRVEKVERFLTRPDGFEFLERELDRLGDWDRALYSVVIAATGLRRVDRIKAVAAQINARIDNSSATAAA